MATMPRRITSSSTANSDTATATKKRAAKLHRSIQPQDLTLEDWQVGLRRQFGRSQDFKIQNLGQEPIFSEFAVLNPTSGNTYRVQIRGAALGDNHCTCADFATNTLGTCKHIEFTLATLERKRGGKAALDTGLETLQSEIVLQYGSRREVRFRAGTDCPKELARLAGQYFDDESHLKPEAFARFDTFLAKAKEIDPDLLCGDDVLSFVAEVFDSQKRPDLVKEAFPRGIHSPAFKKLLKVPLYDYQKEGALFAARAGRCLIGDEMGLGKTIQALAATEIMTRLYGVQRVLIVCPTSLKHQWEREIEKFTERACAVIGGDAQSRRELFRKDCFFKITNYDTVYRDLPLIGDWSPDLVILDEAQRIKNWDTRVARSVKKINSPYAIVLTGTPLENRLEELISIVQFVDRFRLGPTFKLLHEHQKRDEHGKVVGYTKLDLIGASLEPILIRRKKDMVLSQLPERLDKNFFVPMTQQQMEFHEAGRELVARIVQKWRRYKFLSESDKRKLMIGLQNMRMSCDSTYLLDHETDHGVKADELVTLLDEIFETADVKAVVFSQWLRMHEVVQRRLEERQFDHVLFHGGVPSPQRKGLVDRFRDDPRCRLFLSTDAGGVGLNLQFASAVVNLDLPWNPAVLEQRIGRVHRLGQSRPVQVVNFVAQGTIEEGMLQVLKFKKSLFTGVLDDGATEVSLGGSRLTRFMETVDQTTSNISASVMEEQPEVHDDEAEADSGHEAASTSTALTVQASAASANPWNSLLETGLALLQQASAAQNPAAGTTLQSAASTLVARDDRTGEPYLRLPMPPPELIQQGMKLLSQWLSSMGK